MQCPDVIIRGNIQKAKCVNIRNKLLNCKQYGSDFTYHVRIINNNAKIENQNRKATYASFWGAPYSPILLTWCS